MGNNKNLAKCRRCENVAIPGTRYCLHCLTHRKCSHCKQELHVSEFQNITQFNSGRCKKCYDLTENCKKCFKCKQLKHRDEFNIRKNLCKECEVLNKEEYKKKYGHRKCTICKQVKDIEKFDYLMKTCKICAKGKKSSIQKKNMSEIHCRYCFKITENKNRTCENCSKTKKCIVCKKHKEKNEFKTNDCLICNECLDTKLHEERKKKFYSNRFMPIISKLQKRVFEEIKKKFCTFNVEIEYHVDFYSIDIAFPDKKLGIEVDGDYWHGNPCVFNVFNKHQIERKKHDIKKQKYLENRGWKIIRFWENDFNKDLASCLSKINIL
jgi:very-short-patch-repair endonuclease